MKYTHFPMFYDMRGKKILFIGGGRIAERRIKVLLSFEGEIAVVARDATDEIKRLSDDGKVRLKIKDYEPSDLYGADIVIACTDDRNVNEDVVRRAEAAGILYNDSQDHSKCNFYFPGVVTKDETVVGITASGKDHARARSVRERIGEMLEQETPDDRG